MTLKEKTSEEMNFQKDGQRLARISNSANPKHSMIENMKAEKKLLKGKMPEANNIQMKGQRLGRISNAANLKHSLEEKKKEEKKIKLPESKEFQMKGQRLGHMSNTGIFSRETIKKVVCISIHNI